MQVTREFLETPVAKLEQYGLPVRAIDALEAAGVLYVKQLQDTTAKNLTDTIGNIGDKHVEALQRALKRLYENDTPDALEVF